jgi:hypothetical protein
MRNLKYIKLFEAFESEKLSKTLAYIKDKNQFLSKIKKICDEIDFPYSKLNDDLFDYLPFNKALKKADNIEDEICKATSIDEFGDAGISGESCNAGKIKRKWGTRERIVSCPNCNGTGIQPKEKGSIKLLKFWFAKEGELVALTGVDGLVRSTEKMSHDINDYTIGDSVTKTKLKSIPTGTYLKLDYSDGYQKVNDLICYIVSDIDRRWEKAIYAIQNKIDGAQPCGYRDWQKIGKFSTELNSSKVSNIKMLIPNKINNSLYDINVGIDISYSGSISINSRIDVEDLIKNAHFALVMDLGKLKQSNYKKVRAIKSERADRKSGSKLELTEDNIRNQNIKRYLDKLSNAANITDDIKNVSKLVKRLIGFKSALYMLLIDSNIRDGLNQIIELYYRLISGDDLEHSLMLINHYSKRTLERSSKNIQNINNNLNKIRGEVNGKEKELLQKLDEISSIIYSNISNLELESIEDLEIANQKLLSYKNILTSSRYKISKVYYFIDYLSYDTPTRAFDQLTDGYNIQDNIDEILSEMDRIKKIIYNL